MASDSVTGSTPDGGGSRKVSTKVVVLSSAAVVAVYGAGFFKTKAAADRLEAAGARQRPAAPAEASINGRGAPAVAAPEVTFTLPTVPAKERQAAPAIVEQTAAVPGAQFQSRVEPTTRGTEVPRYVQPATEITTPPAEQTAAPSPSAPTQAAASSTLASLPAATPAPVAAAADTTAAPQAAQAPAAAKLLPYKDGEYLGWGNCRHGDIQAKVVVSAGRITSATVAQCWTRYSCNWIDPVVPQVVQRQSPNIDYVSGATQSVDAFYWAVIDALSKAK